jgi:hypothetical protein
VWNVDVCRLPAADSSLARMVSQSCGEADLRRFSGLSKYVGKAYDRREPQYFIRKANVFHDRPYAEMTQRLPTPACRLRGESPL